MQMLGEQSEMVIHLCKGGIYAIVFAFLYIDISF